MSMGKRLGAEFLGTFWLVLGGCGSAVLAAAFPNLGIGFTGVSLAFGLTVLTMAYAVGHVSGGHFNPGHKDHGAPTADDRHAGDLGNLHADADGNATVDYVDPLIAFEGATSIIGRGVIVHADADDFKTQPPGNAGKRVACGVIGIAKP